MGGVNLYQYAPNPVGWIDPFGLSNISCTCPNGEVIELTPDEKAMNDLIQKDADEYIQDKGTKLNENGEYTDGALRKKAAISRAMVEGKSEPTKAFTNIKRKLDGVEYDDNGIPSITSENKEAYLKSLDSAYTQNGQQLHPDMKQAISEHIDTLPKGKVQSVNGGLPGLHAEIQSTNQLMNDGYKMDEISVGTYKLGTKNDISNQGDAFEACSNCDGILNGRVKKITTGTSSKNVKN